MGIVAYYLLFIFPFFLGIYLGFPTFVFQNFHIMKNKGVALVCLLFILFFQKTAAQQHRSLDFPLEISSVEADVICQAIDLSAFKIQDFAAVSIIFEGKKMHAGAVQGSVKIGEVWQDISPFGEDAPEHKFISELLYIPAEKAAILEFRFKLEAGSQTPDLRGRIHVFIPAENRLQPAAEPGPDINAPEGILCPCPQPNFVRRSAWGTSFGLSGSIYVPPAVYTQVTHLIVHHSAGTNTSNNWAGVVAAIFDLHVNVNGWADVGYNWLIDPNGVLYEGRGGGDNVRGAHMCGYNNNTMGVCLMGNFVATPPPPLALKTLARLFAWKCCKEGILPTGSGPIVSHTGNMQNISGHRDGCAPNYTECPGGLLYAQLGNLRLDVEDNTQGGCANVVSTRLPENSKKWIVSPNPASGEVRVQYAEPLTGPIALVDARGQQLNIYATDIKSTDLVIPIDHLPTGLYWLVHRVRGQVMATQFVKI